MTQSRQRYIEQRIKSVVSEYAFMQIGDDCINALCKLFEELLEDSAKQKPNGIVIPLQEQQGANILLRKLQDARVKVGMGRTPRGYKTQEQLDSVEWAFDALGKDGQFTEAIDYALGQGRRDLQAIINSVCYKAKSTKPRARRPGQAQQEDDPTKLSEDAYIRDNPHSPMTKQILAARAARSTQNAISK